MSMQAEKILWIDDLDFYLVCEKCYRENIDIRYSGKTKIDPRLKRKLVKSLKRLLDDGVECQLCNPITKNDDMIDI